MEKLERAIKTGRLSKKNINNRGYNKYLKLDGKVNVSIDYEKFNSDNKWDGLKGYVTNTKLNKDQVIEQYGNLWKIEKAFRISKSDLRIRPIFHRLRHRIEAHICIAFCSYKIYKELERKLKFAGAKWSPFIIRLVLLIFNSNSTKLKYLLFLLQSLIRKSVLL